MTFQTHSTDPEIYARFMQQANFLWLEKTVQEFASNRPYLIENLSSLHICPKCFELHGFIRLDNTGSTVQQHCSCQRESGEQVWHGHDFNQEYELCYCCALEVIPTGSRWSPFYCKDCKARIMRLNTMAKQFIIPYGRHSLMNQVIISKEALRTQDTERIKSFVASIKQMNQAILTVCRHRKQSTEQAMLFLGLAKEPRAIDLCLNSRNKDLTPAKEDAFIKLLALMLGRTLVETRDFFNSVLAQTEQT